MLQPILTAMFMFESSVTEVGSEVRPVERSTNRRKEKPCVQTGQMKSTLSKQMQTNDRDAWLLGVVLI